jgi:hypothetical protein
VHSRVERKIIAVEPKHFRRHRWSIATIRTLDTFVKNRAKTAQKARFKMKKMRRQASI